MKVETFVEWFPGTAIEVDMDRISETLSRIMTGFDNLHMFLSGIPDEFIAGLNPQNRQGIADWLRLQAARYACADRDTEA